MSIAEWPVGVPTALALRHSEKQQSSVAEFEPEVGPSLSRRRTTAAPTALEFKLMPMTKSQYLIFLGWFDDDLAAGVNHFEFEDPITGTDAVYKMTDTPTYRFHTADLVTVSFPALKLRYI